MTILSSTNTITYFGNGSTTAFTIPFYFIRNSHIRVQSIIGAQVTAMIEGIDYTLFGAGDLNGGAVQTTVPVPSVAKLKIDRIVPIIQTDDYVAHDTFPAETMEKDLDYLTMICQQLSDSISSLGGGSPINFAMVGTGAAVYAGATGITQLFKRIQGSGATTVTETSTQITIASSSGTSGVDLAADYPWTGHHTWTRQAHRAAPVNVMKSLQGNVDIADGGILLASDYVTMLDMRMRTNAALDGPVDASEGGNFAIYIQHAIAGTANNNGFAGGGIRAQVETSVVRTFSSPGSIAGYFGINNLGTDHGGFGVHTDAYHSGTSAGFSHSTYGFSAEVWKNIPGGIAADAVFRSMSTQPLDYGIAILHNGGSAGFKRGIQFGSPLIQNGGLPGGTGVLTPFTVGIDLSWGQYTNGQAIYVKANDYIILSGQNQSQAAALNNFCAVRFNSATGNFQLTAAGTEFFGVNMTTGLIWQNGGECIAMFDNNRPWVFRCTSAGGVKNSQSVGPAGSAAALPTLPFTYLKVMIDGTVYKIPCYSS